MKILQMTNVR